MRLRRRCARDEGVHIFAGSRELDPPLALDITPIAELGHVSGLMLACKREAGAF